MCSSKNLLFTLIAGLLFVSACKKDPIVTSFKVVCQIDTPFGLLNIENAQVKCLDSNGQMLGEPAATDADGVVEFNGVEPGTYTVSGVWVDAKGVYYVDQGSVGLEAGDKETLHLKLQ